MPGSRREDLTVNTIIGPGTRFLGDVSAAGFVRVDGAMRGRLEAKGRVVVGEQARLESDVYGTAVVIGGVIKGNIFASERVTILSTGLVIGDIITRRIQIDYGVLIHGRIVACGDAGDWERRLAAYLDERGLASLNRGEGNDGKS